MDNLEKYIIKNRDKFDMEEPGGDHFERFRNMLQQGERSSIRFSWINTAKVAAGIFIVLAFTFWLHFNSGNGHDGLFITLADIDQEYHEAEIYYTSLINMRYNEIRSFDFHSNGREKDLLLRELSEMEDTYRLLEQDLNASAGNMVVVEAMLLHYQLKVDILDLILDRLHESGNIKHDEGKGSTGYSRYRGKDRAAGINKVATIYTLPVSEVG